MIMFMHKKHSLLQRIIMATRDIVSLARCSVTCPGCGSGNVNGGDGSYVCHNCGAMWQS
jgi:transposase-like protein